jgi:hypothetical protein
VDHVICIVGVVGGWLVLMLVGTNLVGLIGRGLLQPMVTPEEQAMAQEHEVLRAEVERTQRADRIVTIIAVALTVALLVSLAIVWNIGVAIAAAFVMLSRVPDLIWEIRSGRKIDRATMPMSRVYQSANLLNWVAIPVLWFAVCQ